MSIQSGSLEDVAFAVCSAMQAVGVTVVLCGGGAAAFYAPRACSTRDLDFVVQFGLSSPSLRPLMELGFLSTNTRGTYGHPDTPFTIEFLEGPLAVGEEALASWETLERDGRTLHIINSIDCIRDRLSAAIHWDDIDSARQAAEVAKLHQVDLSLIERWCAGEGGARAFEVFKQLLAKP